MFEEVISDALETYAGDYLENIDLSQIQSQIMKGQLYFTNISLKKSAFEALYPGLVVRESNISDIKLDFKLLKLKSEPIVVNVSGVSIDLELQSEVVEP